MANDKIIFHGHARFTEARCSLYETQEAAAEAFGVSRVTWGKYERGEAMPKGEVLQALAMRGVDVMYILTGQRSGLPVIGDAVREMGMPGQALRESGVKIGEAVTELKESGALPGSALEQAGLSRREKALLANYRGSDEEGRKAMEATASALAHKDSGKKKRQGGE